MADEQTTAPGGIEHRVVGILRRVVADPAYRERLIEEPNSTLDPVRLTPAERLMIGAVRRVSLQEWEVDARRLTAFLTADASDITLD